MVTGLTDCVGNVLSSLDLFESQIGWVVAHGLADEFDGLAISLCVDDCCFLDFFSSLNQILHTLGILLGDLLLFDCFFEFSAE